MNETRDMDEIEKQMYRWRRISDSFYEALMLAVRQNKEALSVSGVFDILETYSNHRFGDPDRFLMDLKQGAENEYNYSDR